MVFAALLATVVIGRSTGYETNLTAASHAEAGFVGGTASVVGGGATDAGATVAAPTAAVSRRNTADAGVGGVVAVVRAALGVVHASDADCVARNALATRTFLPRRTATGCATHISVRTARSA